MKLDYIPVEGDNEYFMYAFYDENSNTVIWNATSDLDDCQILGTEYAQFLVNRRGNIVIVEACGWYGPMFHFRFELTEKPNRVVILAAHAAALYDCAMDDESPRHG